jgi:Raf kinase inhibitor-like YbhB/YbcL family protein
MVARALWFVACLVLTACQAPAGTGTTPTIGPSAAGVTATESPIAPLESSMRSPEPTLAGPFALTSPEFAEGAAIPRRYTCDAEDASPPLSWSGAPDGTLAFALIVDDPDARGFVHWVAFNIGGSATGSLPAGWSESPDASPQGTNSFGRVGYGGPCPPSGTHHYVFRLLALDAELPITGAPKAGEVLSSAAGHILGEAKLTGTYKRS